MSTDTDTGVESVRAARPVAPSKQEYLASADIPRRCRQSISKPVLTRRCGSFAHCGTSFERNKSSLRGTSAPAGYSSLGRALRPLSRSGDAGYSRTLIGIRHERFHLITCRCFFSPAPLVLQEWVWRWCVDVCTAEKDSAVRYARLVHVSYDAYKHPC
jgi:hypothetical protein